MKVLVAVVLAVAALSAVESVSVSDSKLFLSFIKKYNKSYDASEFPARFRNFRASIARVAAANQEGAKVGGAKFGITKFADMSVEEFKNTILMKDHSPVLPLTVETLTPTIASGDLPASFDWRPQGAVTAVKDQEQCGSCWAFSATENIESVEILANKGTNTTMILAPQQIVDCDTVDQGCNGGNTGTAFDYVIKQGGIEDEQHYPYTGQDGTCHFQSQYVDARITSWKKATEMYDEKTLQQNLVSWSPLSVCVDASKWQDYQSGVMTREQCGLINVLDHCVQLVGYETQAPKPYWIVRNSWNTDWGIQGYIWIAMDDDVCGITHEATTAVV